MEEFQVISKTIHEATTKEVKKENYQKLYKLLELGYDPQIMLYIVDGKGFPITRLLEIINIPYTSLNRYLSNSGLSFPHGDKQKRKLEELSTKVIVKSLQEELLMKDQKIVELEAIKNDVERINFQQKKEFDDTIKKYRLDCEATLKKKIEECDIEKLQYYKTLDEDTRQSQVLYRKKVDEACEKQRLEYVAMFKKRLEEISKERNTFTK